MDLTRKDFFDLSDNMIEETVALQPGTIKPYRIAGHELLLNCPKRFPRPPNLHKSTGTQAFRLKMTSTHTTPPSTTKLELRTAYGPVFRDVLDTPPRDCTPEEIPVIDLSRLYSEKLEDRQALAKEIRAAAVNTGFFYIKNHGIEEEKITNATKQLLA